MAPSSAEERGSKPTTHDDAINGGDDTTMIEGRRRKSGKLGHVGKTFSTSKRIYVAYPRRYFLSQRYVIFRARGGEQ